MVCHGSTKFSLYQLVYGHDGVLRWEIKTGSRHVAFQEDLTAGDCKSLMNDDLENLNCHQLCALENIEANKLRGLLDMICIVCREKRKCYSSSSIINLLRQMKHSFLQ